MALHAQQMPSSRRVQQVLEAIKELSKDSTCERARVDGHDVRFCASRHKDTFMGRTVWSAEVQLLGITASNRNFGGRDASTAQQAIHMAVDNWARTASSLMRL